MLILNDGHRFFKETRLRFAMRGDAGQPSEFAGVPQHWKSSVKRLQSQVPAGARQSWNIIRPHFEELVVQLPEEPPKPITISDDGEQLFIPYPSRFRTGESVFLEFGGRNIISLRHVSRFSTVLGTVLFPELFPDGTRLRIRSDAAWRSRLRARSTTTK